MSDKEKPESGFVNLPSPDRDDPASRGATSQDKVPGAKNEENDKSAQGRLGETPSPSGPSEADGGASDADAGNESAKVREMEQRMKDMEALLVQMNQEVATVRASDTRDREEEFRMRLLKDLAESQRLANAGAVGPAPQANVPGSSNVQMKEAANKDALPEKLDTFLSGDLTPMWINTTRGALPRAMRAILDNTLARSRTTPDWDMVPDDEERKRYIELDEQLYGLILSSVQAIQSGEKSTDRQKGESRELYAKIDGESKSRGLESGIATIAYVKRMAKGESLNESATAMTAIMNLRPKGGSYRDGLSMITSFKTLKAKLESEITPMWAVTTLKRAFRESTGKVKELSTPILAVFNASEETNAKSSDLGLATLTRSLESAFEDAARDEKPDAGERGKQDGGHQNEWNRRRGRGNGR